MACFTIASSVIAYHQVKREYLFAGASFLLTFTEVVGIMLFHESLASVIHVMFISGIGLLAMVIILHFKYKSLRLFLENAADFYGLFHRLPTPARLADGNLRILIFNWRDTKHSWAGGAEEYIHQLAKRWVAMGHEVTVFSGNDGKSPRHETLDGVQIIRRGGTYFVYVWGIFVLQIQTSEQIRHYYRF